MFDKSKPNIILLADLTDVITMPKTLGPYKVAHVLRQAGFEVAVIHHLSAFSLKEILHLLDHAISDQTLFVGVNNFFYADISRFVLQDSGGATPSNIESGSLLPHGRQYNSLIKDRIRLRNPRCKLVLGGPSSRDAAHNAIFDYLLIGYSESSVVNLARHLMDSSMPLDKSYRSLHGPMIVNDSRAEDYDFSGCTMRYEDHDVVLPGETLVLEVARGCIFKCAFCSYPMNGKKKMDFIRHMDLLHDELVDCYERFGVTRYIFSDDTVNDSPEKCHMLYNMSKRLPFDLEWWGYIRLDLLAAHPKTIDWLLESGLRALFFGIETLNPPTAKAIGKGGDRKKLFDTVRAIKKKYGDRISLHGNFIHGLPYETMESMLKTTEFLFSEENPLDTWGVFPLTIRPNNQSYTNDFLSDLDRNFEKYGYRALGAYASTGPIYTQVRHEHGQMLWENEHTNRLEVEKLHLDIQQRRYRDLVHRPQGITMFEIAGLGLDLSHLNNYSHEIDWHQLDKLKWRRCQEYKRLIFERCQIPPLPCDQDVTSFNEWITGKHALDLDIPHHV